MVKLIDCTLRDGGYYNSWDFSNELVTDYLFAMDALNVDYVEIGFRTLKSSGFKGAYAFSSDSFLSELNIPLKLQNKIGVMLNGSELLESAEDIPTTINRLFDDSSNSIVSLVRIACHVNQFEVCLPAVNLLKEKGYLVGFNLMQIADCDATEIRRLANKACNYPIDVLYFADSMGSLVPEDVRSIVKCFQDGWNGDIGIHTHDNMGNALANCLAAIESGVAWIDATVTGMGRGPGNVKTEYLALELEQSLKRGGNITPLFELIRKHFNPLKEEYQWGSNPYYYLAGKFGIHPSYIQEMLNDTRYSDEDILAVIGHLKKEGGKRFNLSTLEAARHFFSGESGGTWQPELFLNGKEVLILGAGPSIARHKKAIENYIQSKNPFVIALNTQKNIEESLINIRAACHPIRLLADCSEHVNLPQPLVTPFHMLPDDIKTELKGKETLDFGLSIERDNFDFLSNSCVLPNSLVIAYALAIATSGKATSIYLAGFDGYSADDPRRNEADQIFSLYQKHSDALPIMSITPTLYEIPVTSVYSLLNLG